MSIIIRKIKTKDLAEDTQFDYDNEKVIISDWELGKSVEEHFGEPDVEWFYEISLIDLEKVNKYLKERIKVTALSELASAQKEYISKCNDEKIKELFMLLISYMKKGNGFALITELEKTGIMIKKSSF